MISSTSLYSALQSWTSNHKSSLLSISWQVALADVNWDTFNMLDSYASLFFHGHLTLPLAHSTFAKSVIFSHFFSHYFIRCSLLTPSVRTLCTVSDRWVRQEKEQFAEDRRSALHNMSSILSSWGFPKLIPQCTKNTHYHDLLLWSFCLCWNLFQNVLCHTTYWNKYRG